MQRDTGRCADIQNGQKENCNPFHEVKVQKFSWNKNRLFSINHLPAVIFFSFNLLIKRFLQFISGL